MEQANPSNADKRIEAASEYVRSAERVDISKRLAFLGLTPEDADRLRSLIDDFDAFANDFVQRFYEHLFAFKDTSRFLRDPQLVERLKRAQRDHLRSLLESEWDLRYIDRRHHVGLAHAEVGIEPEFFIGAYNQYVQYWFRHVAAGVDPEHGATFEKLQSLVRVVFLDIGLTLDAYFRQSTQQLRQALDMIWEQNNELRQFAHLTSHDLKTPLATMANLCDEALDEFGAEMPAPARDLIDAARRQTFRMSNLIDEILSATVAPESTESNELIDSGAVLAEALDRLGAQLDQRRIQVTLPSRLPAVWGNFVRLREAFYNLLANAVKFIDRRPGKIDVSVAVGSGEATFCIADNGPGIPAEELERIFAPFRRLAIHDQLPGTGLGLYFTRNLIERQGGQVWVESNAGEGSRFYVRLMLRPQTSDAQPGKAPGA